MADNRKWEEPEFKGLTLLGSWRECEAMVIAQERGTTVLEESDLCNELSLQPDALEAWLSENWIEHDIRAVTDGTETCAPKTMSLVRQHEGAKWDGFSPRPRGYSATFFRAAILSKRES